MKIKSNLTKKEELRKRAYLILQRIILVIGIVVLVALGLVTLLKREYIVANSEESVVRNNSLTFIGGTIIGITSIIIGRNRLKNIRPKILFRYLAIMFSIAGIFLAFNMPTQLNSADQLFSYMIAKQMNHGVFISLQSSRFIHSGLPFVKSMGGYLAVYPFQLGYITYLRLLECFSTNIRFLYFVNILLLIFINYLLYRIVKIVTNDNKLIQNWTLILSFVFLPELFLILFIYGNIPGLCACLAAVYFGLRLIINNSKRSLDGLWCVLLFVLSYQLKSNYQIAVLALGIVFVLHAIKHHRYKLIAMPFITFALMLGSNRLIIAAYETESGLHIPKGLPMITYVAMGLEPHNSQGRGPGWYDGYSINLYTNNNFNSDKTKKIAKLKIKSELKNYLNDPVEARHFFVGKFISTWSDPTFESVWIAPYFEKPQTKVLNNIYYSNYILRKNAHNIRWYQKSMKQIAAWCNFIVIAILVLSIGLVLFEWNDLNLYAIFAILNLIGGVVFHLIWETKSQYVFQYVIYLIPVAAMLLGKIDSSRWHYERKNK